MRISRCTFSAGIIYVMGSACALDVSNAPAQASGHHETVTVLLPGASMRPSKKAASVNRSRSRSQGE